MGLGMGLLALHRPSFRHKDTHQETDMRSIGNMRGLTWAWNWVWSWTYWRYIDRASDTKTLAKRLT